jgi:hypothetical protein
MATTPATAAPATPDTTNVVSVPNITNNSIKGFLGTADETVSLMPSDPVAQIHALSNEELFPLGEKALHDIADDIIVLNEIRTRFYLAKGTPLMGYTNWRDFVEKNSRYSIRTVQRRLNEVNGVRGYTKPDTRPDTKPTPTTIETPETPKVEPQPALSLDTFKRWHKYEREDPGGCTLADLRDRITTVAQHLDDPFAFLGIVSGPYKRPRGATQREALKTRQTLDIPAQWEDLNGKIRATTNVQYQNGQVLNRLIDAVNKPASPGRSAPKPNSFAAAQKQNALNRVARKASANVDYQLRLSAIQNSGTDCIHVLAQVADAALEEDVDLKVTENTCTLLKFAIEDLTGYLKKFETKAASQRKMKKVG